MGRVANRQNQALETKPPRVFARRFCYTARMSWAARRRFVILLILSAIILAFLATVSIATFYKSPSCSDGVQNQAEDGIDCGGPCAFLCTALLQGPTVLFTKSFTNDAGRTDVVASIENKNAGAAAKNVPYRITLFGSDQVLIQEATGVLDLPPGGTVPVYVSGLVSGKQEVTRAFLTITASDVQWFTLTARAETVPLVSGTRQTGTTSAPRVEAKLTNQTTAPLHDVQVIVIVRDKNGNVIAASKTIVPSIPAQGEALAIFTWNSAFSDTPAAIEVTPVLPLS